MMSDQTNSVSIQDLFSLDIPSGARLSPGGDQVLYQLKWQDEEQDKTFSNLYIADLSTGEKSRLTYGEHTDQLAEWSPSGDRIAFVSTRGGEEGVQKLWIIPSDGGEARPVEGTRGEFTSIDWRPDGTHIAASFREFDEREERKLKEKRGEEVDARPSVREVERLHYKQDARGFLPETRYQIVRIDIEEEEVTHLTEGDYDHLSPEWSPDGDRIVFSANRIEDPDYDWENQDIWWVDPSSGDLTRLTEERGPFLNPTWSPDGTEVACAGHTGDRGTFMVENLHIWRFPLDGEPENITPDLDRTAMNLTLSDSKAFEGFATPLLWQESKGDRGERILFSTSDGGRVRLHSVQPETGRVSTLIDRQEEMIAFHGQPNGDQLVLTRSTPVRPAHIVLAESDGTIQSGAVADPNKKYLEETDLIEPDHHQVEGGGGRDQDLWVLEPEGEPPEEGYPLVLQVHGGPHTQYGWTFFHEFQVLASQGYAVAYGNPRGSQGYGSEFARTIKGDWAHKPYEDLMGYVSDVKERYSIDEDRLAVAGGSYGGYMTNWIIGHTDRFSAAVTMRCVSSMNTLFGTSDMGFAFQYAMGSLPWEDPDLYREQSPITYVDDMDTPLLIIHSEEDLRCPIGEAEQLFTSLKWQRKEVKMVRFEGEPHGLSRAGSPLNREERLKQLVQWLHEYTKGERDSTSPETS